MSKRTRNLLIGTVLVLVGTFVTAWLGPSKLWIARASHDWPSTVGVVEDAQTWSQKGNRTSSRTHHARLTYRYSVDGIDYTNDRYDAYGDRRSSSESEVQAFLRDHPRGTEVTVHHDPDDPQTALLVPGGEGEIWKDLLFGALILAIGIWLVVQALLRRP